MKLRQCIPLLAAALCSQYSQAEVNELQILQYTSEARKSTIGESADIDLSFSNQYKTMADGVVVISHEVSHPGADFIKVHFKDLHLQGNAKLVVRNADNSERYEYTASNMRFATFDSREGDDGIHSFSSMSVSNDSAIIEYYPDPLDATSLTEFGHIDNYFYGTESHTAQYDLSDVAPSSTCGVNERQDVQCWANTHPTEFERSRPIARLVIGGRSLCTGWRVGSDNKMFTNNHCVETAAELASTEVWFNYQHKSCNGTIRESVVKVSGKDFLKTDVMLDYTLFSVNNFSSITQFGHLGLDVRSGINGERIYIPQHGAGNPKELAIESDRDTNGLCQINNASVNGRGTNTDMGYYCDTIGGSSGSPVIAASSNRVIALHHLGGCYNKGAKISRIWPQVSTFFNGVVPVGDNAGTTPPAVARFSYQCNFEQCSFDATNSSSSGTVNRFDWQFGDGQTSNGVTAVHTYNAAGNYDVTLSIRDSNNQTNTITKQIIVSSDSQPPVNKLTKGQTISNLAGNKGSEIRYFIDIPFQATNIKVTTSGGSGDVDLYVKKGSKPTSASYDCRPYRNGNNETCSLNTGQGRYHIMLKGYASFSNVSILADYDMPTTTPTPPPGSGNGSSSIITSRAYGHPGLWNKYTYTVPANKSSVTIETSGQIGDVNLYVKVAGGVSLTSYDCKSVTSGSAQTCTVPVTSGQVLAIGLYGQSAYDWVKVSANTQ
ncbi:pre-peptidase C-terminal domain-containing protein [Pseudoalteromonas porphyrae]|uniref:Serine protease n=1 Tax=Pseudoalteromonas porphyrae TaxID=187330 RepID=A0A0N1ENN6_9GAMM|nr:pre-peptidase C-terminal domain-containing protein [Pseudoalteromonas porphyrae]KPH59647.1 hypothetical protein ADS77_16825 [Pseudoalteromonas porphyrae]